MEVNLVVFSKDYLNFSWIWLNDPEVKYLTNSSTFSQDEQLKWYNNLAHCTDYKLWGIEVDYIPIGVCGLKNITSYDCELWLYIGEKRYWGKGIGSQVTMKLEDFANKKYGLRSIWLKVLKTNTRAQNLYSSRGFVIEKDKQEFFYMRKSVL